MEKKELSISQNLMWNAFGNVVYLASQWFLTYITIAVLGYENGGVFSLAMSISSSFFSVATFGMRNFQVSDLSGQFSDRVYVLSRYATSILSAVLCAGFVLANRYDATIVLCTAIYFAFKITEAFTDVYHGIMQRNLRMDLIGIDCILKGVAEAAIFTAVLVFTRDLVFSLIGLVVVSELVVFLFERRACLRLDGKSISERAGFESTCRDVVRLLLSCIPVAVYSFLFNTMGQAPRYFLEQVSGSELLGIYTSIALPITIVQVSANFLFTPFTTPLAMHIDRGDVMAFKRLVIRMFVSIALVGLVALPVYAFAAEPVYRVLFGAKIVPYLYLGIPLVISGVLVAAAWFAANMLIVVRAMRTLLIASVVSFAVSVAICVPSIELMGLNGATVSYITGLVIFIGIGVAGLHRKVRTLVKG